ncbi:PGC-1 and ERR-induced regulator in muscle protein 1-like [Penaeus monodon]|uniref:PGC-1 and ERR-induced regulator in muscle protein 1-like n=1 Tax=Penaeus monodon TaxID=6687 RepID=UPI0018A7DD48|nr:PGC-1 and ERR-induced regulator in muscle protein 1-like [Penaeus monodon]
MHTIALTIGPLSYRHVLSESTDRKEEAARDGGVSEAQAGVASGVWDEAGSSVAWEPGLTSRCCRLDGLLFNAAISVKACPAASVSSCKSLAPSINHGCGGRAPRRRGEADGDGKGARAGIPAREGRAGTASPQIARDARNRSQWLRAAAPRDARRLAAADEDHVMRRPRAGDQLCGPPVARPLLACCSDDIVCGGRAPTTGAQDPVPPEGGGVVIAEGVSNSKANPTPKKPNANYRPSGPPTGPQDPVPPEGGGCHKQTTTQPQPNHNHKQTTTTDTSKPHLNHNHSRSTATTQPQPQANHISTTAEPQPQANPNSTTAEPQPQANPNSTTAEPQPQASPNSTTAEPQPQASHNSPQPNHSHKRATTQPQPNHSHKRAPTQPQPNHSHKRATTQPQPNHSHKRATTQPQPNHSHKRATTQPQPNHSHKRATTHNRCSADSLAHNTISP